MKTLNKSLLAAAVIGAIALPGVSSAATFGYNPPNQQMTYARELFATNGNTITLPALVIAADSASTPETTEVNAIASGDEITVTIVLSGGAQFPSIPSAGGLLAGFSRGAQAGTVGLVPATDQVGAFFNNNNTELTFTYKTAAGGAIGGADFLTLPNIQLTNLLSSLGAGGSVVASIEVRNKTQNKTIMTAVNTIATSAWGTRVINNDASTSDAPLAFANGTLGTNDKAIDVGSMTNRKTRYSPNGVIGSSNPATTPGVQYFRAGGFELDVNQIATMTPLYVRHANGAVAYNVAGAPPTQITVNVTGNDLSPWATIPAGIWLTHSAACVNDAANNAVPLTVNTATNTASVTRLSSHGLFSNIETPLPTPTIYVCFGADSNTEITQQVALAGSIQTRYNMPGLRTDPPDMTFQLAPLLLNGNTVFFQNVNPASNDLAASFLRLTNNNAIDCPIVIDAKDDAGKHSINALEASIAAHESEQFSINVLESGADTRFTNAPTPGFGKGTGKWYVRITAECSNFAASVLNRGDNGVLTNLSPQVGGGWVTPPTKISP